MKIGKLTPSLEDYLKSIYLLSFSRKVVRVKEIAADLQCSMPSVTSALDRLKEKGLVDYEKYGYIELTDSGSEKAEKVYSRFNCLRDFFETVLMLQEQEAGKVACRVEHSISYNACEKINSFVCFYKKEMKRNSSWINKQRKFMEK